MGAVFEATHVDIERRVAIKILHAHSTRKEWVVRGFRNEARASARIDIPNIVEIYDFKELIDGRLLIAMEFLDGPTLRELMTNRQLSYSELLGIIRQICRGLGAAHKAGIIHRDVKPENIILVERDGRTGFVKILDFGVAQFQRDESTTCAVGTPEYMAPEAALAQGDHRTDIYALGCILFELLTRSLPFAGHSVSTLIDAHLNTEPDPPSIRVSERKLPRGFDDIVLRCLAKDPAERYESMAELEAALIELQIKQQWITAWDDLPLPDVGKERREQLKSGLRSLAHKRKRRRRRYWPVLMFGLGLTTAAVVALAWSSPDPTEQTQSTPIEDITNAARAAAARFYFVYPPHDDPQGPTAFREVLRLEAIDDDAALERAAELRLEFADTLVRLGDRYWGFGGARIFAFEYYNAALMFHPHPRALDRTSVPPGVLEQMRTQATNGDFSEQQLLAMAPLVALAEPDDLTRQEQLVKLRDEAPSVWVATSIDRILENERGTPAQVARRPEEPTPPIEEPPSEPLLDTEPEIPDIAPLEQVPVSAPPNSTADKPAPAKRMPSRTPPARSVEGLVRQAQSAHKQGRTTDAETLYNRALAANHRNVAALDGLASLAFSDARYGEAVRLLERATKHGPGSARRWLALGDAYYKTLQYTHARQAYEQAKELGSGAATRRLEKVDERLGSR